MKHNIEIHWEITNDCNLKCKHCIVSAGDYASNNDVNTDNILTFLDLLKGQENVLISFTGGEPFKRKEFDKILSKCISNKFQIQIITNGLLFNKAAYEMIKKNNIHLGISIESFNKEHYEIIRGHNTFDRLIKNINTLKNNGISFDIYTTINKFNINDIEEILIKAKQYNAMVHFNEITVDGRAKNNNDILVKDVEVINQILKSSKKVYGIDKFNVDDNCWATNETLFINYIGDIYLCTEQNRCDKRTRLGSIKTFPIDKYYEKCPTIDYYGNISPCPYKVYFNDYITYVSNTNIHCPMITCGSPIKSLEQLYNAFDELFSDIIFACKKCNYKDCMGFIWLLKSEKEKLDKANITTITMNNNIDFLYFLKDYENISIDKLKFENIRYPKCEHRCNQSGKCLIHKLRPLVCHMYPIGLETAENGTYLWVLHDECQFVQDLISNKKLYEFVHKATNIINRIDYGLYSEIVLKYKQVDDISLFLNGINSYIILKEVDINVKM
ncbi:radical SAM domain protein [Firmicutes bacterium CAG:822]|nr:radical SAM domain protein [Firmicutes bacterium CAG:822]